MNTRSFLPLVVLAFSGWFASAQPVFKNNDLEISKLEDKILAIETTDKTAMYLAMFSIWAERKAGSCYSGDAFGSGQVWLQLRPCAQKKKNNNEFKFYQTGRKFWVYADLTRHLQKG